MIINYLDIAKNNCGGSILVGIALIILAPEPARAGAYMDSAHGDASDGASRSSISSKGYSRGNCANCHEQHASIDGTEPLPVDGSPQPFSLFAENFNTAAIGPPYYETDNICFSCHSSTGSQMQVTNYKFANTFGGYTETDGPVADSILDAYTPYVGYTHTQHNLVDVWNYARNNFSWFTDSSNPCVACHNPHLAKRNNINPTDPDFTAISRPTDHENLWGDEAGELMNNHTYQPPFFYNSTTLHEPAGSADHDGSLMPDYNAFCLDCHTSSNVYSTKLLRNLKAIDWGPTGDMHGGSPRYAQQYVIGATLKEPYDTTLGGTSPNYVLSCMDCHEPHGTVLQNESYLLRKAINGERVPGTTIGPGHLINKEWNWMDIGICQRCHNVGTHCGSNEDCMNCHYHGSIQSEGCTASWGPHKAF